MGIELSSVLIPALYIALGTLLGGFMHAVWARRRQRAGEVLEWLDETYRQEAPPVQTRVTINRIRDIQL